MKAAVCCLLGLGLFGLEGYTGDKPYIPVGTAKTKKTVLAFPEIRPSVDKTTEGLAKTVRETVINDLTFMNLFNFMSPTAFVEKAPPAGIKPDSFKYSDWSSIGAEFLIKGAVSKEEQNIVLEVYLYDVLGGKAILSKRYVAAVPDIETLSHTFANNVVETLTGLPGIFLTKIAMSCDRTGKKEVYVMNFDGTDVKQITNHRSISFAPAWSADGTRVAYSLFTRHRGNVKNIDLYEFDFRTSTYRMLSNRKGINSGASYAPDGSDAIALTMSFLGDPEIFILNPSSNSVTRLTSSFGVDVDPNWGPDAKSMTFVSSRAGRPMIFSMGADGSAPKRLTYAGHYNATPTWSPRNNKIAFAGYLEHQFDIFTMNPDGTNIERLSKNQGNNEDPFFSPDGNFLVFSSNRTGQKNIYVMDVEGTAVKRLTYGLGNCVSPKWSNPPKP